MCPRRAVARTHRKVALRCHAYNACVPDTHSLLLFIAAGLLLNLTPGPDVLYIVGRSVGQGRAAGIVSAFGIAAGCLVHITAAVLGLSALMIKLPVAFAAVQYAG